MAPHACSLGDLDATRPDGSSVSTYQLANASVLLGEGSLGPRFVRLLNDNIDIKI